MRLDVFLELVEIKTKLASLFPFLVGLLFSAVAFNHVDFTNMILFFIAMIIFDMTTTTINNLMDYKKAENSEYQKRTNIIGTAELNEKKISHLIYIMIFISSIIGIILTYRTSLLLLAMGGICFFIGIFYTFGPIPLSRMPLGEIFSGLTMGFGIFFITVYLNIFDLGIITFSIGEGQIILKGQISAIFAIAWVSVPLIFTIADIMLANNLCDLDQDISNHRYTLPFYIGKKNGLKLFSFLAYSCYFFVVSSVLLQIYSWPMLVVLLTLPIIHKNVQKFKKDQEKKETFSLSIKNLIIINVAQLVGLILCLFTK